MSLTDGDEAAVSSPPSSERPLALKLDDITAAYGSSEVLHGVKLSVPQGHVVALLGPNGAGKSSLMRVATGLLAPSSGKVLLDGRDVTKLPVYKRSRLGLCDIPEGRGIFPSLTVKENLILGSLPGHEKDGRDLAAEAFPILGNRLKQLAGSLSGGEQQMLALTRTYMTNPTVVLLDEVSLGLSPIAVDQVYTFLEILRRRSTSLVLIEQYVRRALELADYVYVLDKGSVVLEADSKQIGTGEILEAYLGYNPEGS